MTDKKKEKPKHLGRGLASLLGPITLATDEVNLPAQGQATGLAESGMSSNPAATVTSIARNYQPDKELRDSLQAISVDAISPNPYQPRTVWDQQELADLAESIKANGVVQPIIVRPAGAIYEIIAGERRFRAAKMAGLATIPALVRQASDEQMLEWSLIENIHRANLNSIERAKAYQNYLSTFSLTQAEAAERLGENRSVIANYLRLLDLPDEVRQMLAEGQLTMGHARAMLSLPTDELRRKLANRAMAGRLSVREVERLVQRYLAGSSRIKITARSKPAHLLELESELSRQLGTRVAIETRKNGQRGKIIIEFNSLDEFDRITERIGLAPDEQVAQAGPIF
jgi:ParB family chromosome partitioning protein